MKDFHQLKVWEKSHQLALAIYKATEEVKRMLASLLKTLNADG
jgi:hypothetical protein